MKLSVIMPVYNEAATLREIVQRVLAVELDGWQRELIVVDDGSSDGSHEICEDLVRRHGDVMRLITLVQNCGKGAAVRRGLQEATGDVTLIQDADLEYDPRDYRQLLTHFGDPSVVAVFGSRNLTHTAVGYWSYYWGGRLITLVTNVLYRSRLTDQPTCYKSARTSVLRGMDLRCNGFEFCAELTAKILRSGHGIVEVPIDYRPRTRQQGKKLRWQDGLQAAWTLVRLRMGGR